MLRRVFNSDATSSVKVLDGRKVQGAGKRYSRTLRAVLADGLIDGSIALKNLSPRQAAAITATKMVDARTVRTAPPRELAAMRADRLSVKEVRRQQLANRRMSNAEFKRMLIREGVGRALDLIDELTRPQSNDAATSGHVAANDNDSDGVAMPEQLSL